MIAKRAVIGVVIALAAVPSFAADDPLLWPLHEGQRAEFIVHSTSRSQPWIAQQEVGSTTNSGSEIYFTVTSSDWGTGTDDVVLLRSTEQYVFRLDGVEDCTVAMLGPPGSTVDCDLAEGTEFTMYLVAVAAKVPAGSFAEAHLFRKHVEYADGSVSPDWDIYVAPGVGLIKQILYDSHFGGAVGEPKAVKIFELFSMESVAESPAATVQDPSGITPGMSVAAPMVERRVATFGNVVQVSGPNLILEQETLKQAANNALSVRSFEHRLPIGYPGNHLRVATNGGTQVAIEGELRSLSDLDPGTTVLVSGTVVDDVLRASIVTDMSNLRAPSEDDILSFSENASSTSAISVTQTGPTPELRDLSLCLGQNMEYDDDPDVREFQGCYGGPSASGSFPGYHVPIGCPLVGCWTVDYITWTYALAGWNFDFPIKFSATSSNLIYHVPGSVSLNVEPFGATEADFTFSGGLGFNFGINIDFSHPCFPNVWDICHDDVGTINLDLLSMIHQATGPAPLPGDTLEIEEVACPGAGIEIPETPISLLTIEFCEDLEMIGDVFEADAIARGIDPLAARHCEFEGPSEPLSLTPDSLSVDVTFDDFWWIPDLSVGAYIQLVFLGQLPFFTTPSIPIADGPFPAITTPFPAPGSVMTVATDPESPVGDLRYLTQPTEVTLSLDVDPAPTRMTFISSNTLAEGSLVQVLLQEDYTDAPINGAVVALSAGEQTQSAVTDADGIAHVQLPIGEYMLNADFEGSDYYLPSSADQGPVYVYRPSNFVVWGGNAEGVQMGMQYMLWGAQWWKQISGGDFLSDASFKGYAAVVNATSWFSPPANASQPPAVLVDYLGVIVTTQVSSHGANTMGNIATRMVVRIEDPFVFSSDPGHPVWGEAMAEIDSPNRRRRASTNRETENTQRLQSRPESEAQESSGGIVRERRVN
jgi:hypothetical protein